MRIADPYALATAAAESPAIWAAQRVYEADHNPFVYCKDYKSLCDSKGDGVLTYTGAFSGSQMQTDLNCAAPPAFVWFTPNLASRY